MPQVAFHVLPSSDDRTRLRFACQLTERAYLAGERVFVALSDTAQLQQFDDLLWTFADRSFVPHEPYRNDLQWQETPVLLSCGTPQPAQGFDLLVNLSEELPAAFALCARISEIVDCDEARRRAGRQRYRDYRDRGITAETHNIPADKGSQAL
jgi:DNA polymerase-3 subunit chi